MKHKSVIALTDTLRQCMNYRFQFQLGFQFLSPCTHFHTFFSFYTKIISILFLISSISPPTESAACRQKNSKYNSNKWCKISKWWKLQNRFQFILQFPFPNGSLKWANVHMWMRSKQRRKKKYISLWPAEIKSPEIQQQMARPY